MDPAREEGPADSHGSNVYEDEEDWVMSKPSREYVLIPKDEYEALTKLPDGGAVDAVGYARASLARDLLAARKAAELTQAELAKRLHEAPL